MMSGTSIDAVDTALVDLHRDEDDPGLLHADLLDVREHPWPTDLRGRLLGVLAPATSDVGTWTRLHAEVGDHFAHVAARALDAGGGADLVCCHGQTLFHGVDADGHAWGTLQIGDMSRVAAATGTSVLYDVRSADLARHGHGAPLAPVLDTLLGAGPGSAVLNLGGIANATVTTADGVLAGDLGPANALIDAAVHEATDGALSCDQDGRLARTGQVDRALLEILLADPFFSLPLPRSTGREHFDGDYVARRVREAALAGPGGVAVPDPAGMPTADLVATLTEFTATTVAQALAPHRVDRVIGSGGGMRNPVLVERLEALMAPARLEDSSALGVPPDAKEALLMALLGYLGVHGMPALPLAPDGRTVTGSDAAVVLGALTPPVLPAGLEPRPGSIRRMIVRSPPAPPEDR
ncbi:anhydro-N-acetylmuramic acid kinase [Brachybacterium huguangmaarense]|uniref:Anhydro-N-acetylmuramic acid kinase n=1 Tax=Brachybacterium huguangmaarense TaxID=1652028 RepID=A0ABY6G2G0_9MICO|nr:anhydro-N-acetylmuramic acid kinase [Brachybacterium huguangmaarense]UYG17378.1 anhydro-N-acetylmuramic acid kinase [Brachybacterium huguangmaarense]